MEVKLRTFDKLSLRELYQILQLREAVYTFEQKCTDKDIDGLDDRALHLFIEDNGHVVACARFFEPGVTELYSFGRLVVAESHRGQGLAQDIFKAFLGYVENAVSSPGIVLSSQYYIRDFYKKYGFVEVGDIYDEGGIDHIKLERRP